MFNRIERKLRVEMGLFFLLPREKKVRQCHRDAFPEGLRVGSFCVTFYEHCVLRLGALTFANLLINTNDHSGLHSHVYHVRDLISSS